MKMQPINQFAARKAAELEPTAVRAYLIKQGWRETGKYGRGSALFAKDTADGLAELIVPTHAEAADRALLMVSLVAGLSGVEDRPAEAVIGEICASARTYLGDLGAVNFHNAVQQYLFSATRYLSRDVQPRTYIEDSKKTKKWFYF